MTTDPEDRSMQPATAETSTASREATFRVDPLVAAARAGSVEAFEQLYRQHAGRIHGLCLRLVAEANQAELLTQDVFVRAWQRLDSFRHESQFSTWLHRLAVNVVLDWRRQQDRRLRHEQPGDEADPATVYEAVPPAMVAERLDLQRAIAALPDGARLVFVLHDVEGYPLKDVAAMQRIAIGTVKAQLFRARRLLREALQ